MSSFFLRAMLKLFLITRIKFGEAPGHEIRTTRRRRQKKIESFYIGVAPVKHSIQLSQLEAIISYNAANKNCFRFIIGKRKKNVIRVVD